MNQNTLVLDITDLSSLTRFYTYLVPFKVFKFSVTTYRYVNCSEVLRIKYATKQVDNHVKFVKQLL